MSGPASWWLDLPHKDELWCYTHNLFSDEECDFIIKVGTDPEIVTLGPSVVGGGGSNSRVDEDIRKSTIGWLPVHEKTNWIFQRITAAVTNINNDFYKYDLTHIENIQFTVYKEDSNFYGQHIDAMYETNASRKLSVSVQLTDPTEYDGGEFALYTGKDPAILPKQRGTALFFPSWSLHEVMPVTRGTRYALVTWICGPRFK